MKIFTHILAFFSGILLIILFLAIKSHSLNKHLSVIEINRATEAVEHNLNALSSQLIQQISQFCATVGYDRDFVMKLIVEKEYAAPEIADIAGHYMKPMGFSFLEITDSAYKILSSGHFPAQAGNKAVDKADLQDSVLTCFYDNIKGRQVLSLQVKLPFQCEGKKLYCIGGVEIDFPFIQKLSPCEGVEVFLKQGNTIVGNQNIESLSELKDNQILINDRTWLASSLAFTWSGQGEIPKLILLMKEPVKIGLTDLFKPTFLR